MSCKSKVGGFSLVELMVAIVILGIITAIALPSYSSYLVRSSRSAAQTQLMEMAALQEKIYLNSSAYTPNIEGGYNGSAAANITATTGGLGKATGYTADDKYEFKLVDTAGADLTAPSQTFELRAIPRAGKAQAGDGCILIRENGLRQWHQGSDACAAVAPVAW